MHDAFDIASGLLTRRVFREFREGARLRYECVHQFAAHGSGNSPEGTKCDAVFGFCPFELLDGLSRCAHFLADLPQAKAERFARRGDPPTRGTGWEAAHDV